MKLYTIFILCFLLSFSVKAQQDNEELARKATDPTSLIWQLQLEDYWKIRSNQGDRNANDLRIRAVIPFEKSRFYPFEHLLRITTKWQIQYNGHQNLSDTEIFDLIIPRRYKWGAYSLGPIIQLPTYAPDNTAKANFAVGLAVGISFNNPDAKHWQLDILMRYLDSFNTGEDRISIFKLQPSLTYHIRNGYYLETEPVVSYDFYNDSYYIPINLRFGRAFTIQKQKINAYIEPEYGIWDSTNTNPQWGIRFGWRFILYR
ncbi:hypothetical protein K4L44_17700 [Halosquirtibacter laminarini]|uniref:Uncharacterized protein n=1 Tax=Halosquirtibacter laminarini TaxID=3374600 RepID=A0AC61NR28_9BACT|nr:hypothetical protein K4L44_17700 [Prolixibacteraceae bacterium]